MVEKVKIVFDKLTHKQYDLLIEYLAGNEKSDNLQGDSGVESMDFYGEENPPLYKNVSVGLTLCHNEGRKGSINAINGLIKKVLSNDLE